MKKFLKSKINLIQIAMAIIAMLADPGFWKDAPIPAWWVSKIIWASNALTMLCRVSFLNPDLFKKLTVAMVAGFMLFHPEVAQCVDQGVTQLTEDTSPTADDLLYAVNDPLGTPGDRKVKFQNIWKGTLPSIAGNSGKGLSNNGAQIFWEDFSPLVHSHVGVYQPLDQDLIDIAALSCTSGQRLGKGATAWECASGSVAWTDLGQFSGLTADTSILSTDLFLMTTDPGGTPVLRKATVEDVFKAYFTFGTPTDGQILKYASGSGVFEPSSSLSLDSFKLPNSDDPDVSAAGGMSYDTDGWVRLYSALYSAQVGTPDKQTIQIAIQDPENLKTHAGRSTKSQVVWANTSGMSFKVTRVLAISDATGYTFKLYQSASLTDIGTANDVDMETSSFACSSAGTGGYYVDTTTGFEDDTIETGKYLIFEHSSGTAESLHITIEGYYMGDVN